MSVTYYYHVDFPGEPAAGLTPYTENVAISVQSGDPGGEPFEFAQDMRELLAEWFDGADVTFDRAVVG